MAPGACREPSSTGITGVPATIINYHPVSSQKSRHGCAALCLGESPAQARLKCLDLHCSFEALMKAEYGGRDHFAAQNYAENVRREETGICGITYERAAIEILAIIDWAAEFVKISRSPVPEIPGFLRRPFIKGKLVKHPIPDDPSESIHKEKCVRTKAQKAWTYLCALLQFWTDEATTESGDVMYGGRCRPANPMIARIRAMLNPSFRDHFKITWVSIAASTSWTQARLYFGVRQGAIPVGARPHGGSTEPAGSCGRRKMGKVPQGGSARDPRLEFLNSVLGRHRFYAPSVIRTAGGPATDGSLASDGSRQCASRVRPHSSEDPRGAGSSKI